MKTGQFKIYGMQEKQARKSQVYSNTTLLQETGEISNKQPNSIPKATRKRRVGEKKKKPLKLVEGKKS